MRGVWIVGYELALQSGDGEQVPKESRCVAYGLPAAD